MKPPKSITIIRRKLGKHRAHGQAHDDGTIEIDERLTGLAKMQVLIHEWLHVFEWALPEKVVDQMSRKLALFLHKNGARLVEKGNTLLP
jgi:hypothetical protein